MSTARARPDAAALVGCQQTVLQGSGWSLCLEPTCPRSTVLAPFPPPSLRSTIYGCSFDGAIPDSWAQLGSLQDVAAAPGNPGLCAAAPPGASFSVCNAQDPLCINPLPTNTEACAALAPATPSSSSSFPVAAVAAPLAVAAAFGAVAAGLLWRRRVRRRSADLAASKRKAGLLLEVCERLCITLWKTVPRREDRSACSLACAG